MFNLSVLEKIQNPIGGGGGGKKTFEKKNIAGKMFFIS